MPSEKFYVTQEGYNDLQNELENLVHHVRPQVIIELQEARAQGDLSENADYDAAREHQAQVEARIREVEAILKQAEIIEEKEGDNESKIIHVGSVVTIEDLSDNEVATYTIVGTTKPIRLSARFPMNPRSYRPSSIKRSAMSSRSTRQPCLTRCAFST